MTATRSLSHLASNGDRHTRDCGLVCVSRGGPELVRVLIARAGKDHSDEYRFRSRHRDERPGPPADLDGIAVELVAQARAEGVALTGEGGLLSGLIGRVLEGALDVEMAEHVGYAPHAVEGRGSGNSRNGFYPKTVRTEIGDVRIDVPRDRNGTFEPVTVPVGQRRLSGLDDMVISLHAKGLTTGDITAHLEDIYGTVMDRSTISRITDRIAADMEAWSRPLDAIYPVILIDGIRIKIRDGHVSNRTVYVAMGITLDGERDILGLWVGPTGGESAKYWMGPLTDLKNRGVADVLILCCDGLKGLPDAARAIWDQVEVQLCVVHLVRTACATRRRSTGRPSPASSRGSTPRQASTRPRPASLSSPASGSPPIRR